ncbi:uncharacterized protein LOC110987813 [Acanthaster planci]|uniref:Uncharacterized protein LOC110987813 n=1 Tax=Acanthaster planci TaxID=133434 RepID=A0A8B7ZNH4_ACAPL|nr:uncharacterized protein LOC110987813 [Acanthaster planci]
MAERSHLKSLPVKVQAELLEMQDKWWQTVNCGPNHASPDSTAACSGFLHEIKKAIHQTSSGRASGKDSIPAEIYEAVGPNALKALFNALQSVWDEEKMRDGFLDTLIVSLYKSKGSRVDCGNYTGISLLSIAWNIMAPVILNRLGTISERTLPQAQCGFRHARSTVDMIFAMFIKVIWLFHDGMTGQVLTSGEATKEFAISNRAAS